MSCLQTGWLSGLLPQGSPPPVPPLVGAVAAPSNGAGVRHQVRRSGGCWAPSFTCGGCWGLCWLCVGGSALGRLAGGHVRQGNCRHQGSGQRVRCPTYRRCARAPKQAGDVADDESSGCACTESSSESSSSSLESAGSAAATANRSVGESALGAAPGKRNGGAFVGGGKSAAARQRHGGGTKRKRGPAGASSSKSAGGDKGVKPAPKRWRLPIVGGAVRVHGPVAGGPQVVLGGGSVGSRPAAGGRLRGCGADGRASPAGRPQKVPRRGEGPEVSRPGGESTGGKAGASGVAWKCRPRVEDKRTHISL